MEIRPAVPDDVPGVLPLVARICALHEQWDPARFKSIDRPELRYENWLRRLATDDRAAFFVADRDGRIVGYIIGTIETNIPIYVTREYGWVHDLYVDEAYRHEGVGRQLTMLLVERFKSLGVDQVRLETAIANEPARKLFESCGFRASVMEMLL